MTYLPVARRAAVFPEWGSVTDNVFGKSHT